MLSYQVTGPSEWDQWLEGLGVLFPIGTKRLQSSFMSLVRCSLVLIKHLSQSPNHSLRSEFRQRKTVITGLSVMPDITLFFFSHSSECERNWGNAARQCVCVCDKREIEDSHLSLLCQQAEGYWHFCVQTELSM